MDKRNCWFSTASFVNIYTLAFKKKCGKRQVFKGKCKILSIDPLKYKPYSVILFTHFVCVYAFICLYVLKIQRHTNI